MTIYASRGGSKNNTFSFVGLKLMSCHRSEQYLLVDLQILPSYLLDKRLDEKTDKTTQNEDKDKTRSKTRPKTNKTRQDKATQDKTRQRKT
jgi:hypothetical protein